MAMSGMLSCRLCGRRGSNTDAASCSSSSCRAVGADVFKPGPSEPPLPAFGECVERFLVALVEATPRQLKSESHRVGPRRSATTTTLPGRAWCARARRWSVRRIGRDAPFLAHHRSEAPVRVSVIGDGWDAMASVSRLARCAAVLALRPAARAVRRLRASGGTPRRSASGIRRRAPRIRSR